MPIYRYKQIQINYYRERQEETLGDLFGVIVTLVDILGVIDQVGLVKKLDMLALLDTGGTRTFNKGGRPDKLI
jgi:hypothetical protein